MLNKRGVSGVIAVVLLILLTITAVIVLSAVLIPFAKNNLNESTRCGDVREGLTIVSSKTCYDDTVDSEKTDIRIRRGNIDIDGIFLAGSDDAGNPIEDPTDYDGTDIPSKGGGEKTYNIPGKVFKKIAVGPIISDKRCPILDEIEINKCR